MTALPINSFAEEAKLTLPEFEYSTFSYKTFAETKIPREEIFACFPENIEMKYEDGMLYVKDLGAEDANCVDGIKHNYYDGELVDGYWRFEITPEEYNTLYRLIISYTR
jgi:hypothetical protein